MTGTPKPGEPRPCPSCGEFPDPRCPLCLGQPSVTMPELRGVEAAFEAGARLLGYEYDPDEDES